MSLHEIAFHHVKDVEKAKELTLLKSADLNKMNVFERTPLDEANAVLIMRGEEISTSLYVKYLRSLGAKEGREIIAERKI